MVGSMLVIFLDLHDATHKAISLFRHDLDPVLKIL
jgi:hypothetical protein